MSGGTRDHHWRGWGWWCHRRPPEEIREGLEKGDAPSKWESTARVCDKIGGFHT